jgi:glycosyltransferase involved in cell wall biosynthesis
MKNLLFISSYPLPLGKGSNQHAYFFLKALTLRFNVYCVFFLQPAEEEPSDNLQELVDLGIKNFEFCQYKDYISHSKYVDVLKEIFSFPGVYMNLATHQVGLNIINDNIDKYAIDIVHIEHMHYLKYAIYISNNVKKAVVFHDLYHLIPWQQQRYEKGYVNRILLLIHFLKLCLFEKQLENRVHRKIFLNPVEMLSMPRKSVHIPHIVNPEIRYNEPVHKDNFHILFLGGYNHPPNRVSVRYIVDSVVPKISAKLKKFTIHIVGSGMEKFQEYVDQSPFQQFIAIRGFEKDINRIFQGMDIAFFPILYGGGIKTKIIESMAAGVPVVTTPEGVVGLTDLPENCVGVGRTPDELIDEFLVLAQNYTIQRERSRTGREYVDRAHSFDELLRRVSKTYGDL